MESVEMNKLVEAWKICSGASNVSMSEHENAFKYIEDFKQRSNDILPIGFNLASQSDNYQLAHFGLQLIAHSIKFRWNDLDQSIKFEIKTKLCQLIANIDNPEISKQQQQQQKSPNYFRNNVCLTFIELIKREWPQNWPTLLTELFEISNKRIEQRDIVLCLFKFIAEEFLCSTDLSLSKTPAHRRKDIYQYMNANMEVIFNFFLDSLEFSYNSLNNQECNKG
jgi:exportin-5